MLINVIDLEHDSGRVIEIGLTTINQDLDIVQSYSLPVKVDFNLSPGIVELTGWTDKLLSRRGLPQQEIKRRLFDKYGIANRIIVTDSGNECNLLESFLESPISKERINISTIFKIKYRINSNKSLTEMLNMVNLEFEGREHSGKDDSLNIARLFKEIMSDKD